MLRLLQGVLPVPFPGRLYHRLKELKYCYNFKDLDRNKPLKDVYKNEGGILGLYRGIIPTTLGVAPYVAINFALYEKLREMMDSSPRDFSNPVWKLSAGAVSSFIGGVLIYPLDLLRKRYQVASMAGGELGFQYRSVAHALHSIFTTEGFFGAYKGLTANLYKIVPSMAVSWLCYDTLKDWINRW